MKIKRLLALMICMMFLALPAFADEADVVLDDIVITDEAPEEIIAPEPAEEAPAGDEPVPGEAAEEKVTADSEMDVDITDVLKALPEDLHLDRTKATLCPGDTGIRLRLLDGEGQEYAAVFTTSAKKYVTVSADGTLKGVAVGKAAITATAGDRSFTCAVTVSKKPTKITLSPAKAELTLGKKESAKYTVKFPKGYGSSYGFTVADPSVATVDEYGTATALKKGRTKVTVRSWNGKKATSTLTVYAPASAVKFNRAPLRLAVGMSATLSASPVDTAFERDSFSYASENEGIATVDAKGRVTAVAEGETNIIATAISGGVQASCPVYVLPAPESISLSAKSLTLGIGNKLDLATSGLLMNSPEDSAADWALKTSDKSRVAVSGTTITAKLKGKAVVTITAKNCPDAPALKLTVNVKKYPKTVKLNKTKLTLGVDMSEKLKVSFDSGAYSRCRFTSSDPAVATVDEDTGTVTAVSPGTASITCACISGSKKASCAVTVLPAPEEIAPKAEVITAYVGKTGVAVAGTYPEGTKCGFTYSTEDVDKISVDGSSGALTFLNEGEAAVTLRATNSPAQAVCHIRIAPAPTGFAELSSKLTLGVGNKLDLVAAGYTALTPEDAATSFKYASSKKNYVSVTSAGVVKGLKQGTRTITVKTHNGLSKTISVTVKAYPKKITLSPSNVNICAGMTAQLKAAFDQGAYSLVKYTSSDTSVATVDPSTGLVTAVAPGTAKITCACVSGTVKATRSVTVCAEPTEVSLGPAGAVVALGDSFTFTARANDDLPAGFTFSSDTPDLAEIDAETGVMTALRKGTATLRATAYNGVPGTIDVEIADAPERLTLAGLEETAPGEYGLTLTRLDSYTVAVDPAPYAGITISGYSSSNTAVATVSLKGVVKPLKSGSADITVTAYNGATAVIHLKVDKWTQGKTFMISHAMGGIGGKTYSNCLEAFKENYKEGHRIFEVDMEYTSDKKMVLWHDWNRQMCTGHKKGYVPTYKEFMSHKIYDKYTPMDIEALLELMHEYPDVRVVTDSKYTDIATVEKQFKTIVNTAKKNGWEDALDRFIVEIYTDDMLRAVKGIYPFKGYLYTLYKRFNKAPSTSQLKTVAAFCRKNGVDMIAMYANWWKAEYASVLKSYDIDGGVYSTDSQSAANKFFNTGVKAIFTNFLPPV